MIHKKNARSLVFLLVFFAVFTPGAQAPGDPPTVRDIDGNVYGTIRIGDQVWMTENLKVTRFRDGTPIPEIRDDRAWSGLSAGALCWYENDPLSYKNAFGALYNFYAVADRRGLCPTGWHVPTIAEWRELENFLGGGNAAGDRMKDVASGLWKEIHPGASDAGGFAAVPAGGRGRLGSFGESGYFATWWTSTADGPDFAWHWGLYADRAATRSNPGHKGSGFSVRCLKDE